MERIKLNAEQALKLDLLLAANTEFHKLYAVYRAVKESRLWPEQETALLLKVSAAESLVRQRKQELFDIED